jgi:hypothetical protein
MGRYVVAATEVILLGLPTLMCDIIGDIVQAEPSLHLLANSASAQEAVAVARAATGVVTLLASQAVADADLVAVLGAHPDARGFTIADRERSASLYEVRLQRAALGELSRDRLLDALRDARGAQV